MSILKCALQSPKACSIWLRPIQATDTSQAAWPKNHSDFFSRHDTNRHINSHVCRRCPVAPPWRCVCVYVCACGGGCRGQGTLGWTTNRLECGAPKNRVTHYIQQSLQRRLSTNLANLKFSLRLRPPRLPATNGSSLTVSLSFALLSSCGHSSCMNAITVTIIYHS